MPRIALLIASARVPGNGKGLASWLASVAKQRFDEGQTAIAEPYHIDLVDPTVAPLPLGPVVDGIRMAAQVKDPRSWSDYVSSCHGFIVLSPQYNWAIPGELKNSFDHLYWEWRSKPVALAGALLREVLGGGFKMDVVNPSVEIALPSEYVAGDQRVPSDGQIPDFLQAYEPAVREAVDHIKEIISGRLRLSGS
ncbi:flavoprotein [Amylocystis lapponica]|nr:flavoprotein [Amylocystis lapponica]